MGDMLTLIEQAEKTFDAEQAAKAAAKLTGQGGEFTLDDFLQQMQQLRKMGSLSKIMGMLPGMGQFREQLENFDEREIDRIQAIIQSMTPAERANPKIIDGSRRARIARGSGTQVSDVNGLVDRFFEARKMMKSMAKGGGMPGMPGMPGHAGAPAASGPRPSRRPQEGQGQAGLRQPRQARGGQKAGGQTAGAGPRRRRNPFGLPAGADGRTSTRRRSTSPPTSPSTSSSAGRAVGGEWSADEAMSALRFRGPVLPDGEVRDLYVVDGRVTYEPVAVGRARRRGLDRARAWWTRTATSGSTRTAPSPRTSRSSRRSTDRDAGALLLRDCGSAADTSWIHEPRRPAAADPRRPAHRPHPALHPQLRPRDRARRAAGVRRPGGRSAATAGSSSSGTGSSGTPAT